MYRYPCPWCGKRLKSDDELSKKRRCPQCLKVAAPLYFDDPYMAAGFPFVEWHIRDDVRYSRGHAAMLTHGIDGTNVYHVEDPVLSGWWEARRKGLRPCHCMTIEIVKEDVDKRGLAKVFVKPLRFDPWKAGDKCEKVEWGEWAEEQR